MGNHDNLTAILMNMETFRHAFTSNGQDTPRSRDQIFARDLRAEIAAGLRDTVEGGIEASRTVLIWVLNQMEKATGKVDHVVSQCSGQESRKERTEESLTS